MKARWRSRLRSSSSSDLGWMIERGICWRGKGAARPPPLAASFLKTLASTHARYPLRTPRWRRVREGKGENTLDDNGKADAGD
eukprot:scaffold156841_cov26-Tisochrysis_lutea.AAC.1